jgi:hypothetical protein
MEIKRGNAVIADVHMQSNSFTEEEVMGNHTVQLTFIVRHALELMIGDSVTAGGYDYRIRNNEKTEKKETSLGWQYTVTFYSSQYELQDVSFFLHGAPERKKNFDYYNGTATQWLALIVGNMNRDGSGWQAGSVIESGHINMSFKDKSCAAVLTDLCKELDTEYWISGKTISIGRREYAANGLRLGQGEGMGFKDLTLTAVSDTPPVTVLYPYGSDKNLTKEYGNDYLILPGGKLSIEKNTELYGRREQSVQFDDIFPKGEFRVTQKTDNFTLRSADIDFNLTDYLIQDTEAIVTFQDGELAGYDLAITDGSWNNAVKEFRLKPNAEENALDVPGDINFKTGDTFILTNIRMPQKYIDEAEAELLAKATEHLERICDKQVQLAGKCDDILFKQFGLHVACGQMVGILSDELKIDREIRCTKVKKYLENDREPYRYEITVSDFLKGDGLRDLINEVKNVPDEISRSVMPVKQFTKRTWQDVMQTWEMLFDPESDFFTEMIQPLAVQTAQLIVGTNSQQMSLTGVKFIPNADDDPNYFKSTAGNLEHFTINPDGTIRTWTIPESSHRLDNNLPYYVYAKCTESGSTGSILVTEGKIRLEEEAGYYHFLIGVLNTPVDNVRSWQPMYGYTEIAGEQITTGVMKNRSGSLVVNLNEGLILGKLVITAGSFGYDNLIDKPDLGIYATTAQFDVLGDRITANVTAVNQINQTIQTAGWITASQGNTLYAAKSEYNSLSSLVATHTTKIEQNAQSIALKVSTSDYNGNTIASLINQTATTIQIQAGKINLTGAVSFSMFNSSLQSSINNKADTSGLGSLAFESTVEAAQLGTTIIEGGYLNTDYIKVKRIDAIVGNIANFTISDNYIGVNTGNADGMSLYNTFIKFRNSSYKTEALIGENVLPATAGNIAVARFVNKNNNQYDINTAVVIAVENSGVENRFLDCSGAGGIFSVGIKWISNNPRTIIRATSLPYQGQVDTAETYPVRYSIKSQCFYIQA